MDSSAPQSSTGHPAHDRNESDDPGYARYVLIVLFCVYLSNHIDRQILMILLEPIKAEFGVSDFMMGFLSGPTFALFYTVLGIPLARYADRSSRRRILTSGSPSGARSSGSSNARNSPPS